ncbi:DUF4399 domain-containing protein [Candidatus Rariloculus sp.]|uniref:DUF4399 domain-containing protein n=1 Tax=Candidatus Rariloculus sp. TaxID=3101265 RepID=UPI003D0C4417
MRTIPLFAYLLLSIPPGLATAQDASPAGELPRTPAPDGAMVYFLAPQDGATVSSPFTVSFGLRGIGVAPAGVVAPDTGHHHLLIDVDEPPPEGLPLPATDLVRHFGGGQTETELELPPGQHALQLVLGDALHIPHDPPVRSEVITITVAAP